MPHTQSLADSNNSELNKYEVTRRGKDVAIIAAGTFYQLGEKVVEELVAKGLDPTLVNPRFLSGADEGLLHGLEADHQLVITLEDGVLDGGFGEKIARFYGTSQMAVKCYGFKKEFADRFAINDFLKANRLTSEQIVEDITDLLKS